MIKPGSVFSGRIQGGSAPWTSENYGFQVLTGAEPHGKKKM